MITMILLQLVLVVDFPFKSEKVLAAQEVDKLELFRSKDMSIFEFGDEILIADTEGARIFKFSKSGEIVGSYTPSEGVGPGELKMPNIILPHKEGFAVANVDNGQFVLLDFELKYIRNIQCKSRILSATVQGDRIFANVFAKNMLAELDPNTFETIATNLPRVDSDAEGESNLSKLNLSPDFAFMYQRNVYQKKPSYDVSLFNLNTKVSSLNSEKPNKIIKSLAISEDLLGTSGIFNTIRSRFGSYNYIDRVVQYNGMIIVAAKLGKTSNFQIFDFYALDDLKFMKRFEVDEDLSLIYSIGGPNLFFLMNGEIHKATGLNISNPSKVVN